ncbi:MAG: hypothetical protein KC636_14110, partial [Myxococcales bacterium]|nr:hypothetical protein [Myxococcales bacterium]
MSGRPITLAAALRDAQSGDAVARNLAIRHLAPLILEGLGPAAPRWQAWELHPSGAQARAALRRAWTSDPEPAIRGVAATGLAQLGDPTLLPDLEDRLPGWRAGERGAGEPDLEAARFVRECGLIALSLLGAAAREA